MKIFDQILMCLHNLFRRKARTILTITGVVVGTCSIVVMISLGIGSKAQQDAMLAQMGDLQMIDVYNWSENPDLPALDDALLAEIQQLEGVEAVTPMMNTNMQLMIYSGRKDRYEMYGSIVGVYPDALEKMGFAVTEGRFFTSQDAPFSVMIGAHTDYNFRDTKKRPGQDYVYYMGEGMPSDPPFVDMMQDPLLLRTGTEKEDAKPIEKELHVVGRLEENGAKDYRTYNGIYMSVADLKNLITEYNKENGIKNIQGSGGGIIARSGNMAIVGSAPGSVSYQEVKVKVSDISYVEQVEEYIKSYGFDVSSMESIRRPMEEAAAQQQLLLGGIGAISLFVAAIGITNTMIMSIYERTREIGIMKVLGCYIRNIRTVFLMEAGFIGLIGGLLGVGLSYAISFGLNLYGASGGSLGMDSMGGMGGYYGQTGAVPLSIIPLWLVGLAILFSVAIGLLAGFYPANRAVRISALEAIKHE